MSLLNIQAIRSFVAGIISARQRLVVVFTCLMILLVPLHSAFEERHQALTTLSYESTDFTGDSKEPGGSGWQHGVHCSCSVVAFEADLALRLPPLHAALRFVSGPSGILVTSAPPPPPPPRS